MLLRQAGLRAKKSWGQNFLCHSGVLADIVAAARAAPERTLVELGAGLGALTEQLLLAGSPVIAIERDREIVPVLQAHLGKHAHLQIRQADAGRLDYAALAAELKSPLHVVGNLPYQLSSRILVNLADAAPHVESAVVMVQREVADRLIAHPPGRDYGLLSVLVQRRFTISIVSSVPPSAFHPPPKVHSAVVRLVAVPQMRTAEQDRAMVIAARAAFCARRKTLRNALMRAAHLTVRLDAAQALGVLKAADIDPGARAETLHLNDFARLGTALSAAGYVAAAKTDASTQAQAPEEV
jgi:16S rRNA (adenine1518-N6/adenine1519-N6)-dimethyltransferase